MLVNVALAVRMWSPQLTPPKQIHIILFIYLFFLVKSAFKYYRQIEPELLSLRFSADFTFR